MPKRHDNLFEGIVNFRHLHEAAMTAICGKRAKPGAAAFMANLETNLVRMERALRSKTWRGGSYTVIEVNDPKPRRVSAAPFRDRVVHHALCKVVEPIFERGFIEDSFANRVGKGTHRAVARYEHFRDHHRHVLRCDIFRYFPAIDHAILKADLRRRIACEATLWLLDTLIDDSNPQEEVNLLFPGDDLFSPFARRRGLPIGNLTSQFFGNVYLNPLDHYVKEVLQAPYVRYVDDCALFHDDPVILEQWRSRIVDFLAKRRLVLHPHKTFIIPSETPACFLGYVLLSGGRRRLPEENIRRFRNRLRGLRDRWRSGTISKENIFQRINSWIAHAEHADTRRLRHTLFHGGWFDPLWEPDGPPVRVLRGGSWNNEPDNARSANRNRNDTTNRNNNNGFRPASTLTTARAAAFTDVSGEYGSIHGLS